MKSNGGMHREGLLQKVAAEIEANNSEVKYDIYMALQRAAQAEAQNITVERHAGRVILRGTARTWVEREEVEAAARNAAGVVEVQNEIKLAV